MRKTDKHRLGIDLVSLEPWKTFIRARKISIDRFSKFWIKGSVCTIKAWGRTVFWFVLSERASDAVEISVLLLAWGTGRRYNWTSFLWLYMIQCISHFIVLTTSINTEFNLTKWEVRLIFKVGKQKQTDPAPTSVSA